PGSKAEVAPPEKVVTPAHPARPAQPKQHVAAARSDCGVSVEVKEVDVAGKGTGVGAVAGGVGGAVIGHQIGENRTGTAIGAAVGAVAGHQIERQARAHKRYDITVRMNDGATSAAITSSSASSEPTGITAAPATSGCGSSTCSTS